MALTLALATLSDTADAAQPAATLGVYAGAGAPDAVATFESRLGRPVTFVHDTFARENWGTLTDPRWFVEQWSTTKYAQRVVYTVPMLPDSGGTLAEGARGAYNEHFRTLAQRLVAGGQGNATLRIGPEFNGNWFRWTIAVPHGAADFAAFWRQIVTTMRSVPGANFKFDWCPNNGSSYVGGKQLQASSAWPGDAYVDYVGLDVYDQSWATHRANAGARWNEYLTQPNGLRWHRAFAAAHGKPMTFPEWGIANRHDGYGGGDSPLFIERMYEWIRTNNVAYHLYFEYADPNADYAMFNGKVPNSARRFVELFGSGSTGAALGTPAARGGAASTRKRAAGKKAARCVGRTRKVRSKGRLKVRRATCVKRTAKRANRRKKVARRTPSASASARTAAARRKAA
ncbi:MAG: glycoside hydrolase family 26 protein [Solirubrobacteraceae bacterium]